MFQQHFHAKYHTIRPSLPKNLSQKNSMIKRLTYKSYEGLILSSIDFGKSISLTRSFNFQRCRVHYMTCESMFSGQVLDKSRFTLQSQTLYEPQV